MKKINIRRILHKPLKNRHIPKVHAPRIVKVFRRKHKKMPSSKPLDNIKIKIVSFNLETEKNMFDYIADKPFQQYVKELIEKDMAASSSDKADCIG